MLFPLLLCDTKHSKTYQTAKVTVKIKLPYSKYEHWHVSI